MTDNSAAQPLAGLVVVELGTSVAAPTATMILAELGAQVFKVENPRGGDDARAWGPPFFNGDGMNFVALNRNKRSVAIDLKNETERAALRRFILARADIVVQNLRAGVVDRFKLDAASLTAEKPSLIYCNLAAFGARGPRADKPGYDPLMQAFGGIMSITGHDGDEPVRVGPAIIDKGTGMWLIIGALAALHRRTATGRGCVVDGSLYETALHWMAVPTAQYLASQRVPRRMGSENLALAPYRAFEASDGWLVIAAGNDGQFSRLAAALGHPEWAQDARFRTNPDRVVNRAAINALVAQAIAAAPRAHWQALLDAAAVPCAPVLTIAEVLDEPQSQALGMLQQTPDGGLSLMGLPLSFDGERPPLRNSAPRLGDATDVVLGKRRDDGAADKT
ncbi:MAG TPA: CoA transferase [Xanthobacteraceae bacterium]|nr:CoA transferase [Xanthobacteraceae bacterium]